MLTVPLLTPAGVIRLETNKKLWAIYFFLRLMHMRIAQQSGLC